MKTISKIVRSGIVIGLAIVFSVNSFGQQEQALNAILQGFVNHEVINKSHVGIQIRSVVDSKVVAAYQDDKLFIPASTLKVLYTMSAVDQLGEDFRYKTTIKYKGDVLEDGSLEGDLIIEASGDPSLASARFGDKNDLDHLLLGIYNLLIKNGINCIDGDIVVSNIDNSNPVNGDWLWEDIGNYYAGGAWGLNFNENLYDVEFKLPGKIGRPTQLVQTNPGIPFLRLKNEVITGSPGSGDQAFVFGGPFEYNKVIKGTLPAGSGRYSIKGAIPDPPKSFLILLHNYLDTKGIYSSGIRISPDKIDGNETLGVHKSPEMIKLARTCNNHSINLYSEAFGKLLLLNNKVDPGGEYPSHQDWIEIFERYELPADEIYLSDACGLSGSNLITANAMNTFHLKMLQELGEDTTLDILPQNGSEGNVSRFITDKRYRDRLWLKSGYVSGVLNYTGIFRSVRNDELYIFTIFVNHNNNKISKLREEIKQLLSDLVDSTG